MNSSTVIAIVNQKGGTGKTATCANLGIGLARQGNKVLLVDFDPQGSLTISLGIPQPDQLDNTVAEKMMSVIEKKPFNPDDGIIHHEEGVDLIPANIALSSMDLRLAGIMGREKVLKKLLAPYREKYDHILIDCTPSLGLLTVNALTAANRMLIPVQPQYLSVKGVEQLFDTYRNVREEMNPTLRIDGILWTMVDGRKVNSQEEIISMLNEAYGKHVNIFDTKIPVSDVVRKASGNGISVYKQDPKGKVAEAYANLTKEVVTIECRIQQRKNIDAECR